MSLQPRLLHLKLLSSNYRTFSTRIFQACRRVTLKAFEPRFLLPTNIFLSVSLSAVGDLLQQSNLTLTERAEAHDLHRTAKMAALGLPTGIICHFWYIWLDKNYVGTHLRMIAKKAVIDQLVLSPVLWLVYFGAMGLIEQSGRQKFIERLHSCGIPMYAAEWFIWPPAQAINFYWLPTKFRVLYSNIVTLGFNWYISYLVHDQPDE
uniref:Mpv17-like protein 2 n=1 Tax=Plectus sambesii TaxID=2011161 RepID=A0A914W101_9BILA